MTAPNMPPIPYCILLGLFFFALIYFSILQPTWKSRRERTGFVKRIAELLIERVNAQKASFTILQDNERVLSVLLKQAVVELERAGRQEQVKDIILMLDNQIAQRDTRAAVMNAELWLNSQKITDLFEKQTVDVSGSRISRIAEESIPILELPDQNVNSIENAKGQPEPPLHGDSRSTD